MLIDLLNSSNYIMVNKDAISILGLNTAVYCSELLNIYKKAYIKKKLFDERFFKIDREYITKQTSLSLDDQLKCDENLSKVKIIETKEEDKDMISFNIELYASILSSEDVKLLGVVSKNVKVKETKTRESKRETIIKSLKDSIECKTYDVLVALRDWIDTVMENPANYLSKQQVKLFKETLDDYCNGDVQLALKLINIAIANGYKNCQWAINVYEKEKVVASTLTRLNPAGATYRKVTSDQLSEEVF